MEYTIVFFYNGLLPFITDVGIESALREAANRAGAERNQMRPLRNRGKRVGLWDESGNLIAIAYRIKRPG